MVTTYDGYLIYYKQQPFTNVVEANKDLVFGFIRDWCAQHQVNLVAEEWYLLPLKSIIGRSVQEKLQKGTNPFNMDTAMAHASSGVYAREGDIHVKMHPRTWD